MKKRLILSIFSIILFFVYTETAAAFSDIDASNKYYNAINFLSGNNIISGYSDGTFKPFNTISRAEFAKIIIRAANLPLNINTPAKFSDIDKNAWYAPYVNQAAATGIVSGDTAGTFRPADPISKAEALKMIGVAEKWNAQMPAADPFIDVLKTAWYAKYVDFAKSKNLIDQSRFFQPDAYITRGLTSDILYKSSKYNVFKIIKFVDGAQPANTNTDTGTNTGTSANASVNTSSNVVFDLFKPIVGQEKITVQSGNVENFLMIDKGFFENITLDANFPTVFYKNEIYKFEGSIGGGSYDTIFVFLEYKDVSGATQTFDFIGNTNGNRFSIPVIFRYAGNYKIGIIPGTNGTSKVRNISVLDSSSAPEQSTIGSTQPNINISYSKNKTTVSFTPPPNSAIKIIFKQNAQTISYFSRQGINSFDVPFQDFYNFTPAAIDLTVGFADTSALFPIAYASNWSEKTINFNATRHLFSKIENKKITAFGLPEKMETVSKIYFSGTTNVDIQSHAAIIKPDGFVDEIDLESPIKSVIKNYIEIIPSGSAYSFSYLPPKKGVYVIGISEITGAAIINVPVYVSNGIPILPDYFDIKDSVKPDTNIAGASTKHLNFVNNARREHNLSIIKIDSSLSLLAQQHSDDMAKNNYFSHVDLSGKSPNDRRVEMGISTEVGENIAKTTNLDAGFEGFMRSPDHRKNILNSRWTKVGFGFSKNSQGDILIAQEFSLNPLTTSDITNMENELFSYINSVRQANGVPSLTLDQNAFVIAKAWSNKMAENDFTGFTSPDGNTLENMIKTNLSYSYIKMSIFSQNTTESFKENIIDQAELLKDDVSRIGIGIAVTKLGDIKTTIVLTR